MKVAIVTPTTGIPEFAKCLSSAQEQTYSNITHYIFVDGHQYKDSSLELVEKVDKNKSIRLNFLEENVGAGGWYGHRIYAACSFIVNADLIVYLDQDNWIEPNHIESLVHIVKKKNLSWAYSLRKIYDKDETFLWEDNCESLGKWPIWVNPQSHLVDTSCFAIRTEVAVQVGHAQFRKPGSDRALFYALSTHFNNFDCTKKHTLCYRLGGNDQSVTKKFFEEGNAKMNLVYGGKFPWKE